MVNDIELPGCTPEPLMSYLKALGVFRLVAEQKDPNARLSWRGGVAVLHTLLDRDGFMTFFLSEYAPTPVIAPWNGGSGFFDDEDSDRCLQQLRSSSSSRFNAYRSAIRCSDGVVKQLIKARKNWKTLDAQRKTLIGQRKPVPDQMKIEIGNAKKANDMRKNRLQIDLRQVWPDELLDWFDAVAVFDVEGDAFYQPLLGSGGNDGRLDYTNNFMQRLAEVLPINEGAKTASDAMALLEASLFDGCLTSLAKSAIGQFNPGGVGGPNGTQGKFEADSRVNPWDYILMIEGTMLFAGAMSRRMGTAGSARSVFPFIVDSVAVGYGSSTASEETSDGSRAELWLPLWMQPTSYLELKHLVSQGRAQLGRSQARNAVEFALAVNLLGVDRGVDAFVRFGFLKRNGLAFLAAPLGRIEVKLRPNARLLDDPPLRDWIDRLRRACNDKENTPARYQSALRNIDRAMFAFASRSESGNDVPYLLDVLRAIGNAERTIASGLSFAKSKYIRPLKGLNSQWLTQADDESPEFRLAASLAGIRATKMTEVGPVRVFLEKVEVTKFINWNPGSNSAVWSKQPLANNLAAVFRRRQLEAYGAGIEGVPINSSYFARLDDVIAFLHGGTDDDKLANLLWGMLCIEYHNERIPPAPSTQNIPFEFGVPRLLVNPCCFTLKDGYWRLSDSETNAKPDPNVFYQLTSGRSDAVSECVTRGARRLKSCGLLVTGYRNRRHSGNPINVVSPLNATRILASLLIPLSNHDLERIANFVLYPIESEASHVD